MITENLSDQSEAFEDFEDFFNTGPLRNGVDFDPSNGVFSIEDVHSSL